MILWSFSLWLTVNRSWPEFFNPFQYWCLTDNIIKAIMASWPLYLYVCVMIAIALIPRRDTDAFAKSPKNNFFVKDILKSVVAGALEEIGSRCIFIFVTMIPIMLLGLIFFELKTLMNNTIYGFPVVYVAAAIIVNIEFAYGHKCKGKVGVLNAWFIGLYLLYIMLTNGLVVSILVHTIFDLMLCIGMYVQFRLYGQNNSQTL